jgi:hypothetical protein
MAGQNKHPLRGFRPPVDEYDAALAVLSANGHTITPFLIAVLRRLRDRPDQMLADLTPYWPEPTPRGRPPHHHAHIEPH